MPDGTAYIRRFMTTTANFEDIVTSQESADTWQISGRVPDRSYATIATTPFLSRAIGDRWLRIPSARLSNDRHRTARRWCSLINRFFGFCISCTLIGRLRMLVRLWNVYMRNRRKVKYSSKYLTFRFCFLCFKRIRVRNWTRTGPVMTPFMNAI